MDGIKKFFDKKKTDVRFKKVGPGKSLSAPSTSSSNSSRRASGGPPPPRRAPTDGTRKAGEAALNRFTGNKANTTVDWSMQAIKAQARREMEAEKRLAELSIREGEGERLGDGGAAAAAVVVEPRQVMKHVMFSSPLLGLEVGEYDTIKAGIRSLLYSQLGEDKAVAACLIIHTCNKSMDKIKVCVETLCKYVENVVKNPEEEKYRRIRHSNKAYQERVVPMEGSLLFLEGAGFLEEELLFNDTTEKFWVFPSTADVERLEGIAASLRCAEPVRPTLERSPALLLPQQAKHQPELPPEFFALSKDELQKEMLLKKEAVEQSLVLRTKAMRDRRNMREVRKYRFTLIRLRFPDGLTLQGTFRIGEKLAAVLHFIRGFLANDWRPFVLSLPGAGKLSSDDDERSLAELFLVPAVILNFQWDADVSDPSLDDRELWGPAADELLQQQQAQEEES